jgi:hypothetical protein
MLGDAFAAEIESATRAAAGSLTFGVIPAAPPGED